jgi:hypothetical protein
VAVTAENQEVPKLIEKKGAVWKGKWADRCSPYRIASALEDLDEGIWLCYHDLSALAQLQANDCLP